MMRQINYSLFYIQELKNRIQWLKNFPQIFNRISRLDFFLNNNILLNLSYYVKINSFPYYIKAILDLEILIQSMKKTNIKKISKFLENVDFCFQ